jgi:hypothetical protein
MVEWNELLIRKRYMADVRYAVFVKVLETELWQVDSLLAQQDAVHESLKRQFTAAYEQREQQLREDTMIIITDSKVFYTLAHQLLSQVVWEHGASLHQSPHAAAPAQQEEPSDRMVETAKKAVNIMQTFWQEDHSKAAVVKLHLRCHDRILETLFTDIREIIRSFGEDQASLHLIANPYSTLRRLLGEKIENIRKMLRCAYEIARAIGLRDGDWDELIEGHDERSCPICLDYTEDSRARGKA